MDQHSQTNSVSAQDRGTAFDGLMLFLLVCVSAIPLWERTVLNADQLPDDVYTSLVYARNLATGAGFHFRPDLTALGTTTPLWVMVIGGTCRVLAIDDVRNVALTGYSVLLVVSNWGFVVFRRIFGLRLSEAALVAIMGMLATRFHLIGGEGPLFQTLLVCSCAAALTVRPLLCGVLTGALFLTRGEGILMAPVAAVTMALVQGAFRPTPRQFVQLAWLSAGMALVLVPWCVFALSTFGEVLPNTLRAKLAQASSAFLVPDSFLYGLLAHMLRFFRHGLFGQTWMAIVPLFFVCCGVYSLFAQFRRMLPLAAWCLLYVVGYAIMRLPAYYAWYQANALWFLGCVAGLGMAYALRLSRELAPAAPGWRWAAAVGIMLLIASHTEWAIQRGIYKAQGDFRAKQYHAAYSWLEKHIEPGEVVACGEIGYLGYFSDFRILDLYGLVDAQVLEKVTLEERIANAEPAYYLTHEQLECGSHLPVLRIQGVRYRRVKVFPASEEGKCIALYRRHLLHDPHPNARVRVSSETVPDGGVPQ